MTTLIIFDNLGKKIYEEISINSKEMLSRMMSETSAIMSDLEGRRLTKGSVPTRVINSLGRVL